MSEEATAVVKGDGYAAGNIDAMGEGYGFRKIRRELDVEAFGINAIVIPPGFESGFHYHDEQEETYFVHQGKVKFTLNDGEEVVLGPGGTIRVDAATPRKFTNVGDEDAVYICAGGKDGYVGRDGRVPEGETNPRGDGSGPPGLGSLA